MAANRRWLKFALVGVVVALGVFAVTNLWKSPAVTNPPTERPVVRTANRLIPEPVAIAQGVYILGLSAPGAAYAVETSAGLVLIDTGLEDNAQGVSDQLAGLGLKARDIRAILLTHVHADHSLGAERLRAKSGAKVYAGRGDCAPLREGGPREAFFSTFHMPNLSPHKSTVDVELAGDEALDFGDTKVQVLSAPGHTPGSVCYLLERAGLRVLFTGDVVQHLSTDTPNSLGTYAAYLAPRYRGSARDYLASLRRLRELPAPDLVLPGHPRMDRLPEDPRMPAAAWHELLDQGIAEMERLLERFAADGEDFLDGSAKELLPGLHYLGDLDGSAVYAADTPSGVFLFDAPGGSKLVDFIAERSKAMKWNRQPAAVVLTSASSEAISGLSALVQAAGCRVYAPTKDVEAVRRACPPGTAVATAADLEKAGAFDVTAIPLGGLGQSPTAYRLMWKGKTVLVSGRVPGKLENGEIAVALMRDVSKSPGGVDEYLRAIDRLAQEKPDLWLPAVPVHGQNANLYDRDWETVLERNRELFNR